MFWYVQNRMYMLVVVHVCMDMCIVYVAVYMIKRNQVFAPTAIFLFEM